VRRLALLGLALALACSARPRRSQDSSAPEPGPKDRRLVEFDLSAGFPETSPSALLQMPATRSYTGLVRALERAHDDPLTAGVLVRLGPQVVDYARAEELGELLGRFRKKNLSVVCHAHGFTNASAYLVARGCSRVWLSAAGSVDSVGIAAELVHLKGLLDRLKIDVQFLAIGKYKSGAESLTRETPSENSREALTSTLGSIRTTWLEGAESGRPGKALEQKLEQGPYTPDEAKNLGIIDAVGFESEARADAKRLAKTALTSQAFGPASNKGDGFDLGALIRLLSGADNESEGKPRIAVVPAEGAIGMSAGGPLAASGITAQSLNRTLKRLAADDSVKAVVLRVDSPGGSPLASDLIWHELMELRKKKPVVASIGSMAASGGYYIACAAQRVVAERTSIIGSIGVFGGKVVVGPALREFGVNAVAISANPEPSAAARATYLSPFSHWDDATRERVRVHMQGIYDLFVARVAEARKLPNEVVRDHAEGRIWSGAQGRDRGLVDELGGLATALDAARKLAGLGRDAIVSVEGAREGLLDLLLVGDDASAAQIAAAVSRFQQDHALLAELPPELRANAAALAPLFHGETVVAALPFAFALK
jgi:protease-4